MKHVFKFPALLLTVIVSFAFCSCSFLNITRNVSSIEIRLPQRTATRSVYGGGNGFSGNLPDNGKFTRNEIDEYEVVITSSTGKSIPTTVPAGVESILIPDVEVGEWSVTFTAYAVDEIDGKKVRTVIAKTRKPVKTTVKADKPSEVTITAELVKYFTGGENPFECPSISKNIASQKYQLVLKPEYILSIPELVEFQVIPNDGSIIEITPSGLITFKKPGSATVTFTRAQDGNGFEMLSVRILPVVKINCFINGENVSGKYPYTKITADDGDALNTMLSNFSVDSIMSQEGLENCDWYFDANFTEKVGGNVGILNLYEKHSAVFNEGVPSTYEINIYADTRKKITNLADFKQAFVDGGNYIIPAEVTGFIADSTLELSDTKKLTINVEGNFTLSRISGGFSFKGCMVKLSGESELKILCAENCSFTFDGAMPEDGNATDKLVQIGTGYNDNRQKATFEGVNFKNNKVSGNWYATSALAVFGDVTLKNCSITNNSMAGDESIAPGIKIEQYSTVVLENVDFTGNECENYPYGLDIWIDNSNSSVTLKGKITGGEERLIFLNYKDGDNGNPVDISGVDVVNSSDFIVTYCNGSNETEPPSSGTQIFNTTVDSNKFGLYILDSGALSECESVKLGTDGKVVSK